MSRAVTHACLTALVLAVAATAASAQQSVELSIAGGWLSPTGGDFADTHAGFGTDLAVRVPTGERYTLGGGLHWSRQGVDFATDALDVEAGAGGYHLAFGDFSSGGSGLGIDGGSGRAIALRLALNVRP